MFSFSVCDCVKSSNQCLDLTPSPLRIEPIEALFPLCYPKKRPKAPKITKIASKSNLEQMMSAHTDGWTDSILELLIAAKIWISIGTTSRIPLKNDPSIYFDNTPQKNKGGQIYENLDVKSFASL